eukprot:scaffold6320_cov169-Amphora_coffeaeformis.AAC.2
MDMLQLSGELQPLWQHSFPNHDVKVIKKKSHDSTGGYQENRSGGGIRGGWFCGGIHRNGALTNGRLIGTSPQVPALECVATIRIGTIIVSIAIIVFAIGARRTVSHLSGREAREGFRRRFGGRTCRTRGRDGGGRTGWFDTGRRRGGA